MINCILAGVGGQGTVLASKLIARAAMQLGNEVRTAETIGMAQRGGCVVSHVRIGNGIFSPLVPFDTADIIIGFEPAEAVRCLPYLKEGGTVIVSKKAVRPVTASLTGSSYDGSEMLEHLKNNVSKLSVVDGEAICRKVGSAKALNIALLGAAVKAEVIGISKEQMENTIREVLPAKFVDMNLEALKLGYMGENEND